MHPSHLRSTEELSNRLRQEIHRYSKCQMVTLFGESILRTSYWLKSGTLLKECFESHGLPPEDRARVQDYASADRRDEGAAALGFPEHLPSSVWAHETLRNQRETILPRIVWDDKTRENVQAILQCHRLSRPGNYRAAYLTGPTGGSKTLSFLAAYTALGIPVEVIRGVQSSSSDVNLELLEGGTVAKVENRGEIVRRHAAFGVFSRPQARYAYYQALVRTAKKNETDLLSAHSELASAELDELAAMEGLPAEGEAVAARIYGKTELARRAGAAVVFDEVNLFPEDKMNDVIKFLNDEGVAAPPNTVFGMTSNPPSEEYRNRTPLNADALGRIRIVQVPARSLNQHEDFILENLGYPRTNERTAREVANFLRADGAGEELAEAVEKGQRRGGLMISGLFGPEVSGTVAQRLASFQAQMEEQTMPGGPLHPATYGLSIDASKPSVRSLASLLEDWSQVVEAAVFEKSPDLVFSSAKAVKSFVDPQLALLALHEAVEREYVVPYSYVGNAGTVLLGPAAAGQATASSREVLDALVSGNELSATGLLRLVDQLPSAGSRGSGLRLCGMEVLGDLPESDIQSIQEKVSEGLERSPASDQDFGIRKAACRQITSETIGFCVFKPVAPDKLREVTVNFSASAEDNDAFLQAIAEDTLETQVIACIYGDGVRVGRATTRGKEKAWNWVRMARPAFDRAVKSAIVKTGSVGLPEFPGAPLYAIVPQCQGTLLAGPDGGYVLGEVLDGDEGRSAPMGAAAPPKTTEAAHLAAEADLFAGSAAAKQSTSPKTR